MPSSEAVTRRVPDSTYMYPFSVSFDVTIPSSPPVAVIEASFMRMLSLAWIASAAAVTEIVPPVITRSSFAVMPCIYRASTVRLPLPLIVRSSCAKIAPSVPSARAVSE